MKFDTTFLCSKVARRIFGLFVLCAFLPIAMVAILAFGQVTGQLNEQNHRRIQRETKSVGMAIFERLLFLDREIRALAYDFNGSLDMATQKLTERFGERLRQRFKGLVLITEAGNYVPVLGRIDNPPHQPTPTQTQYLKVGKTVVSSRHHPNMPSQIFMMHSVDPKYPKRGILLGEIETTRLWGMGHTNTLPPMTELCVLDELNNVLLSSLSLPGTFVKHVAAKTDGSELRRFVWKHGNKEYLASYWTIFLKARFFVPKWTVVLSQSKADATAPVANFKKIFPLVVLLSIALVVLLSSIQIRRSLVPLEKLKEGTERIAVRDFDSQVTVTSGDEFEELAVSFNAMSKRLDKQFTTLTTIAEIDNAILAALDTERIIETVLTHMPDVLTCDVVSVTLIDSNETSLARTFTRSDNPANESRVMTAEIDPEDIERLRSNPERLIIKGDKDLPHYLTPLADRGIKSFLLLPMFLKESLAGFIAIGYLDSAYQNEEDQVQARQLANQVAVALSNAHPIEELDKLNWGTLTALARAVDAKSHWTAGHAERVTDLALKIGRTMGLGQEELKILHRGGLLHDIGKIGIHATILDKHDKLTDEEFQAIKEHPRIGARILEPIGAYGSVIPIVLQHHEWFNGKGYPAGLAGEAICLGARILAVADVFDSLTSDRPYRAGWEPERAATFIKEGAGGQFDPKVVHALSEVMIRAEQRPKPLVPRTPASSIREGHNDRCRAATEGFLN